MPKVIQDTRSPYKRHLDTWNDCQGCHLAEGRQKMVFAKGKLPCDILFVGEAPGESEDVIGLPFVGPAGKLLDKIISEALKYHSDLTTAFTNLVCCIPRDAENNKITDPDRKAIDACRPRLAEMIALSRPRILVAVGGVAEKYLPVAVAASKHKPESVIAMKHPAFILRSNVVTQGLEIQRAVVVLENAADDIKCPF